MSDKLVLKAITGAYGIALAAMGLAGFCLMH